MMMMVKSTALCRLLLYIFALSVLLHCTVSVRADGSNDDVVRQKREETTTPEQVENWVKKIEEIDKNVLSYYETFKRNINEAQTFLSNASEDFNESKEIDSTAGNTEQNDAIVFAGHMLKELNEKTNKTLNKLDELKKKEITELKSKQKEIEKTLSELRAENNKLKTPMESAEGDVDNKDGSGVEKTKEAHKKTKEVKKLLLKILKEIKQQCETATNIVKTLNEADDEIKEAIELSKKKTEEFTKNIKKETNDNPQTIFTIFYNEFEKTQKTSAEAKGSANVAVKSSDDLKKEVEELLAAAAADNNELNGGRKKENETGKISTSEDKENIVSAKFFWVTAAVVWLFHISF